MTHPCFCVGPQPGQTKCPCLIARLAQHPEHKQSGFFNLPVWRTCQHPSHQPPMYIYIPPGMGYRHVCPACGQETVLYGGPVVTCETTRDLQAYQYPAGSAEPQA